MAQSVCGEIIGCLVSTVFVNSCGTSRQGQHPQTLFVFMRRDKFMQFAKAILLLACLTSVTLLAQEAKVTELMSKDLTNLGKEGLMITVEYPPGNVDPVHRHNAHGFIYVLEGTIVMQVKGGKETTVTAGQTFYEGPDDVHVVGRNASKTKPAKFVVFFVKDKGAPLFVAAK
jgi:quercetin dioxygenase-like cupin family protein